MRAIDFCGERRAGEEVDRFLLHFVEAEAVVIFVADDDVAFGVESKMLGALEFGLRSGAVVAGVAFFS